jgi:hypothetical protein
VGFSKGIHSPNLREALWRVRDRLTHMPEKELTGGCLCGAVRFELDSPPSGASYCHCTRCQRRTGTAASANAAVDGEAFRFISGEELVRCWNPPDEGWEKCFCSVCGSHLLSRNPLDHSRMGIRMGAFDTDPGVRPTKRKFVAYAAPWEPIPDDGLERIAEG